MDDATVKLTVDQARFLLTPSCSYSVRYRAVSACAYATILLQQYAVVTPYAGRDRRSVTVYKP